MSDLIRREDVLKAIWDWCCNREYAYTNATYWLQKRIESIPSAERKGEWIRTGRTNIYGGIEVQCSNCGDKVMVQHLEDEWYCRHCGADMGMKGAEDD